MSNAIHALRLDVVTDGGSIETTSGVTIKGQYFVRAKSEEASENFDLEKFEKYIGGYEDGIFADSFPNEFEVDSEKMNDADYKAGFDKGIEDSKNGHELG